MKTKHILTFLVLIFLNSIYTEAYSQIQTSSQSMSNSSYASTESAGRADGDHQGGTQSTGYSGSSSSETISNGGYTYCSYCKQQQDEDTLEVNIILRKWKELKNRLSKLLMPNS